MKRRYKILLIIIMGILFTFLINNKMAESKISMVSLGDGLALGMTSYGLIGKSFNDYLKENIEFKNKLASFNNEFAIDQIDIEKLNDYLNRNEIGRKSKVPIKQIIAKADILTIAVGMDEFMDYQRKAKITPEVINEFITSYQKLIMEIRSFYDNSIFIISLYPALNIDKNVIFKINKKLEKIAVENKCKYLDITAISLKKEYYLDNNSYYMNYLGHKDIYINLRKMLNI